MILLALEKLYEIHKETKKVDDFKLVLNKGVRLVDDKEVFTIIVSEVRDAESLRSALKVIWDEIFEKDYSAWIEDEDYIPYGFEDQEDVERVLEEEPGTLFDALDPYSGEYFVEKIYRNGKLIYSYDD